jgi:hypothetical protein
MAVAGMLPAVREKLFGMEFENLGQLSQKLSLMSNQAYGFKKEAKFGKQHDVGLVHVYLCSNKDRSLSCLRHPFGSVIFSFTSSRMVSVYWQIAFP